MLSLLARAGLVLALLAGEPEASAPKVELNTATLEQLVALPGIGPTRARRIEAYRKKRRFRRVRDLLRVKGIGRKTLARIAPLVRVEPP